MKVSLPLSTMILSLALLGSSLFIAVQRNGLSIAVLSHYPGSFTLSPEKGWETGWQSLCGSATANQIPLPITRDPHALWFEALSLIDLGRFDQALPLFRHISDNTASPYQSEALAYRYVLELDWEMGIRSYGRQPTERHRRFWGTVAYLAAQRRWFSGDTAKTDQYYMSADQLYGHEGPLVSLGLVTCLRNAGRPTEAFDEYRRGLVSIPPDEALSHIQPFNQIRLAGLAAWHKSVPFDERVSHWLAFYQGNEGSQEELTIGVDENGINIYRISIEDIQTGPFLTLRSESSPNQTVVNQSPNGAFSWDAPPNGIAPFGWHLEIPPDSRSPIKYEEAASHRWLCLDTRQSNGITVKSSKQQTQSGTSYIQAAQINRDGDGHLALGREWFPTGEYSYTNSSSPYSPYELFFGDWAVPTDASSFSVWLIAHPDSFGCSTNLLMFEDPHSRTN